MKPIFLIGTPFPVSKEAFENIRKSINNQMNLKNDYHVFFYEGRKEDFNFQVIYEKDFKRADLNELKQIVKKLEELNK